MAAGEVNTFGPYTIGDETAISAGLSGSVVVADDVTAWTDGQNVFFAVVKAA